MMVEAPFEGVSWEDTYLFEVVRLSVHRGTWTEVNFYNFSHMKYPNGHCNETTSVGSLLCNSDGVCEGGDKKEKFPLFQNKQRKPRKKNFISIPCELIFIKNTFYQTAFDKNGICRT